LTSRSPHRRDEFQLSIPWRVALQQCPPPLPQPTSCSNQQRPLVEKNSANGYLGLLPVSQPKGALQESWDILSRPCGSSAMTKLCTLSFVVPAPRSPIPFLCLERQPYLRPSLLRQLVSNIDTKRSPSYLPSRLRSCDLQTSGRRITQETKVSSYAILRGDTPAASLRSVWPGDCISTTCIMPNPVIHRSVSGKKTPLVCVSFYKRNFAQGPQQDHPSRKRCSL
jgi:hypothetical protein